MNQIISMIVALSAIAGVTVYEGIRFGIWNDADPEELSYFAERLEGVPREFGDWTSEEAKVTQTEIDAAGIRAYISRDYVHKKSGAKLNVFLVCGKTHPMAIHSPDQCYAAAGFARGETNRRYIQAEGRTAELWGAQFTRDTELGLQKLDVLWSWAPDDGNWQAPTNPRPHFSNKNALYKIYVIAQPGTEVDNRLAADVFLEAFLVELDKLLFAPNEPEVVETAQTAS
jgi:hypothetical protein